MDSLKTILGNYDYTPPPEIDSIKRYIEQEFNTSVTVTLKDQSIIVLVPSAALANTLRLRSPDIKRRCQIKTRLVFRIA